MRKILGYANQNSHQKLKPYEIERKEVAANEVEIEILYCGICHSDIHQAYNEWNNTVYPCMPGHEIIGRVKQIGKDVTKFKIEDMVGVGCMVDSCHQCSACKEGLEQYCEKGATLTYNGNMRTPNKDNLTFGGYSTMIVVREDFVLHIPATLSLPEAAPLLCAGVTTYSPMKHWKVGKGMRVGIIGLGGLGHVAVQLAKALGAEVTVISTNKNKITKANLLGASHTIISTDEKDMKKNEKKLDFILNTIPESHDVNPYISLLKRDGIITVVGCLVPLKNSLDLSKMIPDRKTLSTSLIGSIAETQDVLEFCAKHNIKADIKLISVDKINEAFDQVSKNKVDFRFVIDMKTLANKREEKNFFEKILT